jgi:hypothetical protein
LGSVLTSLQTLLYCYPSNFTIATQVKFTTKATQVKIIPFGLKSPKLNDDRLITYCCSCCPFCTPKNKQKKMGARYQKENRLYCLGLFLGNARLFLFDGVRVLHSTLNKMQKKNRFLKVCDRLKTPKMASGHYWKVQKNSTKILQKMYACERVCQEKPSQLLL